MADLVVCICDDWGAGIRNLCITPPKTFPVKGIVYTIRSALEIDFDLFYQLEEMEPWYGWYASYFRPVNQSKLDIFRKADLPIPVKKKELEKV